MFIAPSNFLRGRFIEFGLSPEKIIYSDNGINPDLFKDIEKTKSDKIRFGFIGTLIPAKGVHVLIKAFNKVKSDKAVLKIYGKSPVNGGIFDYYHSIRRMARGNENIKFMGVFDNKNAAKVFEEIDVLIFPSIWAENSPLVLHEAILTKTPIIASDIGGVNEFVKNNQNGFLFKTGGSTELHDKINFFIKTPGILEKFKNIAAIQIKSIEENCSEMEKIYELFVKKY
jgi:glycosyltransferase involved in cell wall biosynthesis